MAELESLGVLLLKMETSYNTDASPGVGDVMIVGGVKCEPLYDFVQPKQILPFFGEIPNINVGAGITLSFQTEFRGSGSATGVTSLGSVFRCAGFTQTVGASYVEYDELTTTDVESATAYWYHGNKLMKGTGMVTKSIKPALESNKTGIFNVEMVGMFSGVATMVTESSPVTPSFGTPQQAPVLQGASFAIDGYSALISKLGLAIDNTVVPQKDSSSQYGIKRYIVTDRKISGSCDPSYVALSTYNPWTTFDNETTGALTVTLGSTTGNKCTISSPRVQKTKVAPGARDGIVVYDISFVCTASGSGTSTGNDRLMIRTA